MVNIPLHTNTAEHNHDDVIIGNIFRVTSPLFGEFTSYRWISLTKANDAELWSFIWSAPKYAVEKTIVRLVIWDAIALIMRQWFAPPARESPLRCRTTYRQTSNISRSKSGNLNIYCLVVQLSLFNPMKPGVKSRIKMQLEQRPQDAPTVSEWSKYIAPTKVRCTLEVLWGTFIS